MLDEMRRVAAQYLNGRLLSMLFLVGFYAIGSSITGLKNALLLSLIAVLVAAQVIDNNIIEPLVMGNQLNLSPLFTIAGIVTGELIWGLPGMILFEPLLAILRIACSHVPALHPYAILLENEVSEP